MKYSELLEKIKMAQGIFNEKPAFVIVKKKDGDLLEISEHRVLFDSEILSYTTFLIDYFLAKGTNELRNEKTKEVWKFEKTVEE